MDFQDDRMDAPRAVTTRRDALAVVVAAAFPAAGFAQSDRPVRMIIPASAGSGQDAVARAAQQAMSRALGSPIVLENQAGAGGLIGMQTLARAAPDGYTLGISTNSLVVLPASVKSLPFDVARDFTPITIFGAIPLVVVANPARVSATNAKEFIALLKSNADSLNFASAGAGTLIHLATEMLLDDVGVKVRHIPYKTTSAMITDLIGGQVDFGTSSLPAVQAHIKSGALRAIGVCSAQRVIVAPEIPTFSEQGLPNYVLDAWIAVLGPRGMTPAGIKRVHDAVVSTFNDPAVKDAMLKQGTIISIGTPEVAQETIRKDLARFASLAKKVGIEPQ